MKSHVLISYVIVMVRNTHERLSKNNLDVYGIPDSYIFNFCHLARDGEVQWDAISTGTPPFAG